VHFWYTIFCQNFLFSRIFFGQTLPENFNRDPEVSVDEAIIG